ncbi:MAG: Rha family transcriptional regulator, partial [Arcobacteraceae bacterium]
MNNLIQIVNSEARVSHRIIADGTNNKQDNINQLINKHLSDFQEFGEVEVQLSKVQTPGGVQKQKTFMLNEQQATLLMTYLRNSEIVRRFKIRLVKEFYALKESTQPSHHQILGYKSQLSQHSKKIKSLEARVLLLNEEIDQAPKFKPRDKNSLFEILYQQSQQYHESVANVKAAI